MLSQASTQIIYSLVFFCHASLDDPLSLNVSTEFLMSVDFMWGAFEVSSKQKCTSQLSRSV